MSRSLGSGSQSHLLDSSNVSLSFQIPNAFTQNELLLEDNDADFFKNTSFLETPAPSRRRASPTKLAHDPPSPEAPDSTLGHVELDDPLTPREVIRTPHTFTLRRGLRARKPSSKPSSPTKPKLNFVMSPLKAQIQIASDNISNSPPIAEQFQSLQAKADRQVVDNQPDLYAITSMTNGESDSVDVPLIPESGNDNVAHGQERAPVSRKAIARGSSKTRSKSALPLSTALLRRGQSTVQARDPFHDVTVPVTLPVREDPEPSLSSDTKAADETGRTFNAPMRSPSPIDSTIETTPEDEDVKPSSPPKSRETATPASPLTVNLHNHSASKSIAISSPLSSPLVSRDGDQTDGYKSDNLRRHLPQEHVQEPFTLSQLSPCKQTTTENDEPRERSLRPIDVLPNPKISVVNEITLVASPMRSLVQLSGPVDAKDVHPSESPALAAVDADSMDMRVNLDDTDADADASLLLSPQKKKQKRGGRKTTRATGAPAEQKTPNNDGIGNRNGTLLDGELSPTLRPAPATGSVSGPEKDDSALVAGDSSQSLKRPPLTRVGRSTSRRGGVPHATTRRMRTRSSTKAGLNVSTSTRSTLSSSARFTAMTQSQARGMKLGDRLDCGGGGGGRGGGGESDDVLATTALICSRSELPPPASGSETVNMGLREHRSDLEASGRDGDVPLAVDRPEPMSGVEQLDEDSAEGADVCIVEDGAFATEKVPHSDNKLVIISPRRKGALGTGRRRTINKPVEFKFELDEGLKARKVEYEEMAREPLAVRASRTRSGLLHGSNTTSTSKSKSKSKLKSQSTSMSSSTRSDEMPVVGVMKMTTMTMTTRGKENEVVHNNYVGMPGVTVPVPFRFQTASRARTRAQFDDWAREKGKEKDREEEERKRKREEEEEREVRELRRKAVPRANEVPEWYKDAPKRKRS